MSSLVFFFFFKQKTAYVLRISDWGSDVCSSDLVHRRARNGRPGRRPAPGCHRQRCTAWPARSTPARTGRTPAAGDRKSVQEGTSVSVRVDLGGRRIIKKKKQLCRL